MISILIYDNPKRKNIVTRYDVQQSDKGRRMTMMASGAAALPALLTGRRKRKLEDED